MNPLTIMQLAKAGESVINEAIHPTNKHVAIRQLIEGLQQLSVWAQREHEATIEKQKTETDA